MILVSEGAIQGVMSAITDALVGASNHRGGQHIQGTLDPAALRSIALGAITAAHGDVCWPARKVVEKEIDERLPWLKTTYPRG